MPVFKLKELKKIVDFGALVEKRGKKNNHGRFIKIEIANGIAVFSMVGGTLTSLLLCV